MESRGQIRDDWSAFGRTERPTVEYLRDLGLDFVSVDTLGGRFGPAPDAAIPELRITFDIKHPATGSHSGVQSAVSRARDQSRRVVIDTRGSGMTEADGVTAVQVALQRRGGNFDELLVLGDSWGILWP